jgi:1A family penicillin-binding protein
MAKVRTVARYFLWVTVGGIFALCLGSLQAFATGLDRMTQDLRLDTAPQASLVYDRHGNLVFSFASEDRTNVPLDRVSPAMISAVLAAEDRHFFRHFGMDFIGVARAAWVDLKARAVKQGGSTITQQLIRHVALTRDRNIYRKIKEALLAVRVERKFNKEKILEAYLNRIYLGNGHYGVEAAARGYFAKPASELTVAESALLAGIIPCPSLCAPHVSPDVARSRRDNVLERMRKNGVITGQEYLEATSSRIAVVPERHDPYSTAAHDTATHHENGALGLYFLEAVRQQVMDLFGADTVLKGGLRIYTTLDLTLQRHAEDAVGARLSELDKSGRLEGALVAIDPRTGDVLALVGGRDFHTSPFNRAIQAKRQPGSAFKPLLFAAAIEQGYTPSSLVTDIDTAIQTAKGAWLPSEGHEAADYTLRQALTVSSNRAAVRVMQLVGIGTTQSYARRLGIMSPLPAVPSLALGTGEVTLLDLTSAYGAFANSGIIAPHTLISHIEDRGGAVIWQNTVNRPPYRAIRPGTAYLMSSMLADVINRGTATRARTEGFRLPAAGKTGTTDDYGDAWFVGYTPSLVAGVWFGYDEKKPIMNKGFAGTVAVPAWARFMMKATKGSKPEWFDMPADVERIAVCRKSGKRATAACRMAYSEDGQPNVYQELFMIGTGPYDTCEGVHTDPPVPVEPTATTVPSAVF